MSETVSKFAYLKSLHGAKLTYAEYRVLVTMWDYSNEKLESIYPGIDQLAEDVCMDRRSVRRALASLREKGYARIAVPSYWKNGRRMADEYTLTLPAAEGSGLLSPEVRTEESASADRDAPPTDHVPNHHQITHSPTESASPAGDAESSLREHHAGRDAAALTDLAVDMLEDGCADPEDFLQAFDALYPLGSQDVAHLIVNCWGPEETARRIGAEIARAQMRGADDPVRYGCKVWAHHKLPGITGHTAAA